MLACRKSFVARVIEFSGPYRPGADNDGRDETQTKSMQAYGLGLWVEYCCPFLVLIVSWTNRTPAGLTPPIDAPIPGSKTPHKTDALPKHSPQSQETR